MKTDQVQSRSSHQCGQSLPPRRRGRCMNSIGAITWWLVPSRHASSDPGIMRELIAATDAFVKGFVSI